MQSKTKEKRSRWVIRTRWSVSAKSKRLQLTIKCLYMVHSQEVQEEGVLSIMSTFMWCWDKCLWRSTPGVFFSLTSESRVPNASASSFTIRHTFLQLFTWKLSELGEGSCPSGVIYLRSACWVSALICALGFSSALLVFWLQLLALILLCGCFFPGVCLWILCLC